MRRSKNILIFAAVSLVFYFLFIHNSIFSLSNSVGEPYVPSDGEVNYLAALNTYKGEGLYKGFSIVYPPGRFLAQAALFHIIAPTAPVTGLYFNAVPLFFYIFFFFLCYKIFSKLGSRDFISYILALIATSAYFSFIYSSQEAHALAALFFLIALGDFKNNKLKNFILGAILGAVFLFRLDAGILLAISIIIFKTLNLKEIKFWSLGFTLIWAPILFYMIATGSLQNFFYDVFYVGLIIQPKTMSLPIPPPPVGLVFQAVLIFLLASAASLSIESNKLRSFALFSLLSFTAALNRSDEGHLWYGAVWMGFYVAYIVYQLLNPKNLLKNIKLVIPSAVAFFVVGLFLIKFKSPILFTFVSIAMLLYVSRLKKDTAPAVLIGGLVATLVVFHSLSFLKLRFQRLTIPMSPKTSLPHKLFVSDGSEIAGLKFSDKNLAVLKKVKARLDPKNKWLFIYPDSVIYYEYFKLKNPTRYYYHTGETTDKIQDEIIADLERTRTNNFIIFADRIIKNRKVWQWIKKHTYVDSVFTIDDLRVEVRKLKSR